MLAFSSRVIVLLLYERVTFGSVRMMISNLLTSFDGVAKLLWRKWRRVRHSIIVSQFPVVQTPSTGDHGNRTIDGGQRTQLFSFDRFCDKFVNSSINLKFYQNTEKFEEYYVVVSCLRVVAFVYLTLERNNKVIENIIDYIVWWRT